MSSFEPRSDNTEDLRRALGAYPTGVTVITTHSEIGPLGITANSFASVSLDPPLVLWSPARKSLRFNAFATATHFAIHILGEDQKPVCDQFSKVGHDFSGLDIDVNDHNVPLINGCAARLECRTETRHDGGDHLVIVGRVLRVTPGEGTPLVFARGRYGRTDPL